MPVFHLPPVPVLPPPTVNLRRITGADTVAAGEAARPSRAYADRHAPDGDRWPAVSSLARPSVRVAVAFDDREPSAADAAVIASSAATILAEQERAGAGASDAVVERYSADAYRAAAGLTSAPKAPAHGLLA